MSNSGPLALGELRFIKLQLRAAKATAYRNNLPDMEKHLDDCLTRAESMPESSQIVDLSYKLAAIKTHMTFAEQQEMLEIIGIYLNYAQENLRKERRWQVYKHIKKRKAIAEKELMTFIDTHPGESRLAILIAVAQRHVPDGINWFDFQHSSELPFDDDTLYQAMHGSIDDILPSREYFMNLKAALKLDAIITYRGPKWAANWIGKNTELKFSTLEGEQFMLKEWGHLSLNALHKKLRRTYPDFDEKFSDTIPDLTYRADDPVKIEFNNKTWKAVKKTMVSDGVAALKNMWRTGAALPTYVFFLSVSDPPRPRPSAKKHWLRWPKRGQTAAAPFAHICI